MSTLVIYIGFDLLMVGGEMRYYDALHDNNGYCHNWVENDLMECMDRDGIIVCGHAGPYCCMDVLTGHELHHYGYIPISHFPRIWYKSTNDVH
jgi:hypothetical protein